MFVSNRAPDMISVFLRQNVEQGQSQKQVSVVTVMGDRGIVHSQKCKALDVAEQHRHRISLEKQSEGILLGFQAAHIGQRHGDEIADGRDADAKVRLATRVPPAVELKPGAAPGIENGDETRKRFAGWKSRAYFREPSPTKLLRGSPHEEGRAIVKRGDLEVARLAPRVAKHGKRDKSVGRRLEHGLDEAEL